MFRCLKIFLLLAFLLIGATTTNSQVHFYSDGRKCAARTELERDLLKAVNEGSGVLSGRLLQKGADGKMVDDCGISVLTYAIVGSRPDVVKLLIDAGADVNAVDRSIYKRPLAYAVRVQDPEDRYRIVKMLIDAGANVNAGNGETPLVSAVSQKDVRLVELLISSGADVNLHDNEAESAYSYAAALGDNRLKQMLLAAGADPAVGVAKYLKEWGKHAFFQAAADGRVDVVEAMLSNGLATVNMTNGLGVTALMRAHDEVTVDVLVMAGADVNLRDNRGYTALIWAAEIGNRKVVKKLIMAGADASLRGSDGKAAIDVASRKEIEKLLIDAGAHKKPPPM
jgi:ankyrin repeat protein